MATDIIVGQFIENAFKYSPDGGTVTIRAGQAGDWIEVAVEDTGIGIAPADRERIFERFVQGETGDRRRFGGIGLGLYIVRQLAHAQGAEVAACERPGGGTVMRLRLRGVPPVAVATAARAPAAPAPAAPAASPPVAPAEAAPVPAAPAQAAPDPDAPASGPAAAPSASDRSAQPAD